MIRVALRGLAARPVRTLLNTLAIVVGVAFVCAALTLTDAMRGATGSLSTAAYDGTAAVVTAKTAFQPGLESFAQTPPVPASTLDRVRAADGVTAAVGDITDSAPVIGGDGEPVGSGPYFGVGLDAGTPAALEMTPFRLRDGRWATGPGEVVVDRATAEAEDLAPGATVRVSTRGEARAFEVVGVASFADVKSLGNASVAIFDLAAAQTLFGKEGSYDRILVAGDPRAVAAAAGPDAQVRSAAADDRFDLAALGNVVDIFRTILLAFAAIAVLVGALQIANTLSIAVAQRTRELGLLRMVGASRRQVRRSVLVEALVLGLLAAAVGVALGYLLARGARGPVRRDGHEPADRRPVAGRGHGGRRAAGRRRDDPGWRRSCPPGARRRSRRSPRCAAGGATDGRVRLPGRAVRTLAGLLGRPAAAIGGSAGTLARRNAMRHPGRTAATATALLIGVALVTAVTVVAQGLSDVSKGSLERRVQATAVVGAVDGWTPIDPAVERVAAARPGRHGRCLAAAGRARWRSARRRA